MARPEDENEATPERPDDDYTSAEGRVLGQRYRLDEPDGSWWELGWDRPLGTFYAQQFRADGELYEQLVTWLGCDLQEIATIDKLAELVNPHIPEEIRRELAADAESFPYAGPPPFYMAARVFDDNREQDPVHAHGRHSRIDRDRVDVIVTGYRRSGVGVDDASGTGFFPISAWSTADEAARTPTRRGRYATFEQATRPSIYSLLNTDRAALTTAASFRVRDPDVGHPLGDHGGPIELVRISSMSKAGHFAGRDTWLQWSARSETWELANDPRRADGEELTFPPLQSAGHVEPEHWNIEKEIRGTYVYEIEQHREQIQRLDDSRWDIANTTPSLFTEDPSSPEGDLHTEESIRPDDFGLDL